MHFHLIQIVNALLMKYLSIIHKNPKSIDVKTWTIVLQASGFHLIQWGFGFVCLYDVHRPEWKWDENMFCFNNERMGCGAPNEYVIIFDPEIDVLFKLMVSCFVLFLDF